MWTVRSWHDFAYSVGDTVSRRYSFLQDWLEAFRWLSLGLRSQLLSWRQTLPYILSLGENRKRMTEEYPDPVSSRRADDLAPKTRGVLFNNIARCTGCGDCQVVCPTEAIRVESQELRNSPKKWVTSFEIDLGKCLYCGLCAESCIPGSLAHSREYESSSFKRSDLVLQFGRGGRHD